MIKLLVVILPMEDIKKAIGEAEKELEVAERLVASKRSALMASVFFVGLALAFAWAPLVLSIKEAKQQQMLRHQIKPFDFISSAEALVNEKTVLSLN